MLSAFKKFLIGDPLESHHLSHERLSIPLALSVFAADALSSTAFATEEILIAIYGSVFAAQIHLLTIPVAIAIVILIAIVSLSYLQVVAAYPENGGTYAVSKDRLGITASHLAGASLLVDYVLVVAVGVSAGVAAISSTGLISEHWNTMLALGFIVLMTVINLRGVRESGKVLAFPAYLFIGSMVLLVGMGIYQWGQSGFIWPRTIIRPVGFSWANTALVMVLLNAFSHGCSALTGIEAVSNGVQVFREPVEKNAQKTILWIGFILAGIFLGVTLLAIVFQVVPKASETVMSQVARAVFGGNSFFYYLIQASTLAILVLSANTSFAGFPRLTSILADDGYLPRQLMSLGDKLVFSNGIIILAVLSGLLVWMFHSETHALIPLFAIGVFLSFTLAQGGMVIYHWQEKHPGWKGSLLINGLGMLTTGLTTLILIYEKFSEGAWIVLVAIPLIMWTFQSVKSHYNDIADQLALPEEDYCPVPIEHTVLVLVSSLNRGTIPALEYAKTISDRVEAIHVSLNPKATERLKQAWAKWGCNIPLTVLDSPYRNLVGPILKYVDEVEDRYEHDLVTIIVPEFVTTKWWHLILHNQTAVLIKALLRLRRGKVVTTVRFHLDDKRPRSRN